MDDNTVNPERNQGDRPEGKEDHTDSGDDDEEDAAAFWGDPVCVYTRRQAIEDGVLVDVSETASEAGFRWSFAMTAEVWAMIETIPEKHSHEDVTGRLCDVLIVACCLPRQHAGLRFPGVIKAICSSLQRRCSQPGFVA